MELYLSAHTTFENAPLTTIAEDNSNNELHRCVQFLQKHDTLKCHSSVSNLHTKSPPLSFFSLPAVQINNKALKWRTDTFPMVGWA